MPNIFVEIVKVLLLAWQNVNLLECKSFSYISFSCNFADWKLNVCKSSSYLMRKFLKQRKKNFWSLKRQTNSTSTFTSQWALINPQEPLACCTRKLNFLSSLTTTRNECQLTLKGKFPQFVGQNNFTRSVRMKIYLMSSRHVWWLLRFSSYFKSIFFSNNKVKAQQ